MSRALLVINTQADRERAIKWISHAPWGCRLEFKATKRTLPQNAKMHALITEVAAQKTHLGRRYTVDEWKVIFLDALGREVKYVPSLDGSHFLPIGQSTADLSKEEMSEMIEFVLMWGTQNGVRFCEPAPAPVAEEPAP